MKKQKLNKKRVPWWAEEPWKGWWKKFRRVQARKIGKNELKKELKT